MERVLPVWQECTAAGEVFPRAACFGAVGSPESCLGGRQMACSMPGLRMVQAVPGTHRFDNLRWRCRNLGIAGMILADTPHSWSMGQCTAGTFLSGNPRLWSMVLGTVDMQSLGTLHVGLVALSECTLHLVHCFADLNLEICFFRFFIWKQVSSQIHCTLFFFLFVLPCLS